MSRAGTGTGRAHSHHGGCSPTAHAARTRSRCPGAARRHIIVQPVTHIQDFTSRAARFGDQALEKPGSRLLSTPPIRRADHVHRQLQGSQNLLSAGCLVPGHANHHTLCAKGGQARPGISVETLIGERLRLASCRPPLTFHAEVKSRLEVLERLPVVPASRDDRAEHSGERVTGHTQPVSPRAVLPRLIDECLANIEKHRAQALHHIPSKVRNRLGPGAIIQL